MAAMRRRSSHVTDKAVNGHVVALALVGVTALDQTAADGEEQDGLSRPVALVALPEIFGVGAFFNDGIELGAVVVDDNAQLLVFENVLHDILLMQHPMYGFFFLFSISRS